MIKRHHATSQLSFLLTPHPSVHPLKPRQAFPMTSGYTRVIPVQRQNSLPPNLNSPSWAHKAERQIQYKPQVIPHVGLPAQMRARQDVNMASKKSSATLGTSLTPRSDREQGTVSGVFPVAVPVSSAVFQTTGQSPDCPGRVWFVARVSGRGPGTKKCCPSRSMSCYCCLSINFTGRALPCGFVDYTPKNTVIQKHFRLPISILTMYHLYLSGGTGGKR